MAKEFKEYIIASEDDDYTLTYDKTAVSYGELIRCKDCKFYSPATIRGTQGNIKGTHICLINGYSFDTVKEDDFCSWAERKEETEEWHSLKGNIEAPKGTFDKIYEKEEEE